MKKFNLISLLAVIVISIATFVSCTKEDENTSTLTTANLESGFSAEVDSLALVFKEVIMESDEYIEYYEIIDEFGTKLKNARTEVDFSSVAAFEVWMGNNIQDTEFQSVQEATNLYDELSLASKKYHSENLSFFEKVSRLDSQEFNHVFLPILLIPTPVAPSGSCYDGCETTYDSNMSTEETRHTAAMVTAYILYLLTEDDNAINTAELAHNMYVKQITDAFSDCILITCA